VVALGEVEEMPYPAQPGLAAAMLVAGHLGDLPPGEGMVRQIDNISREGK
jgi:hypothetical protein